MRHEPHLLPAPSPATAQAPNKFCGSDCRAVRSVSAALGTPRTIRKAVARPQASADYLGGRPPSGGLGARGRGRASPISALGPRPPGTPLPHCGRAPAPPPRASETPLTARQSPQQNLRPVGLGRDSLRAIMRDYVARALLTLLYFSAVLPLPSPAAVGLRLAFAAFLQPFCQPFAASFGGLA